MQANSRCWRNEWTRNSFFMCSNNLNVYTVSRRFLYIRARACVTMRHFWFSVRGKVPLINFTVLIRGDSFRCDTHTSFLTNFRREGSNDTVAVTKSVTGFYVQCQRVRTEVYTCTSRLQVTPLWQMQWEWYFSVHSTCLFSACQRLLVTKFFTFKHWQVDPGKLPLRAMLTRPVHTPVPEK